MGHEQVKITERFVLTSDVDPKSVKESTGYFFERNKAATLKKAEAQALLEEEGKEETKDVKKEALPFRVNTFEKKSPVAEPLIKSNTENNEEVKRTPETLVSRRKPGAISKTIQRDLEESEKNDDDVDDQTDDDLELDGTYGKNNNFIKKLSDPMFDICVVGGVGVALFIIYKVSSSRFKIRKAVESIRGEMRDN